MASKKSDLFGSMKMMLPEHRTLLNEHNGKRGLQERPYIDEDELGEMCFRIYDSRQYDYAVDVKWFKEERGDLGVIEEAWGVILDIDSQKMKIKLVCDWESYWINIRDLISVTK